MKIKNIYAREILDSRGNPTVSVKVQLKNGIEAEASVPSGASTGIHEALELRDGDPNRYNGKGVLKACRNVNKKIFPSLKGMKVDQQKKIDVLMNALDGTENKSKLGANAILGVSLACAKAAAKAHRKPLYQYIRKAFGLKYKGYLLPVPMMNIFNGGRHANNGLSIQEFMIVPQARKFKDRVKIGSEVFHALKAILAKRKYLTLVGDEGGFADGPQDNEEVLKLIIKAIKKAGYKPGKDVFLASDFAASEFLSRKKYKFSPTKKLNALEMIDLMEKWIAKYPIISIEDGLAEDDWENWERMTIRLGNKIMLVGDDLFVTNVSRLQKGIENEVANAILIKVNQIGTLSETISAIQLAQKHNYKIVVSHRSGETCDTTIADLAVAVNAEYIKTGSLSRSERISKYNRLMQIEEEL